MTGDVNLTHIRDALTDKGWNDQGPDECPACGRVLPAHNFDHAIEMREVALARCAALEAALRAVRDNIGVPQDSLTPAPLAYVYEVACAALAAATPPATKQERLEAVADEVRSWPPYMRVESSASKRAAATPPAEKEGTAAPVAPGNIRCTCGKKWTCDCGEGEWVYPPAEEEETP